MIETKMKEIQMEQILKTFSSHFCGYSYSHDDLDWGVQSWNYNCGTQTVGNRRQILAPFVGGTIFKTFLVFHFLVYCKLAKNSRKTFSVDKVSALHLKGKKFLSNVYEAAYRWL